MVSGSGEPCPVFRPTVEEFSRPFCEYVRGVLASHKDIAMFKVIPPEGWRPRVGSFPDLDTIVISCPIRQHVFGKTGMYRCLLVEQKGMTAADFEKVSIKECSHSPPRVGRRDDELCERAFWSSVTIRPPLYGADTPQSFFDEDLEFGWNLRDLGCLLKQYPVPNIPGVTHPMTYFGMWKSFFAWHLEDQDLFSVNYLHWGAPKVWYCVPPGDKAKFNQMAQSLFPDMQRECKAFLRHKDILLSPSFLKAYNIRFWQAKQNPKEFIVLNAGAYHSGFNLGFNCAEAVNFATEDWLPLGENATRCTCSALSNAVRISMDMFKDPPKIPSTHSEAATCDSDTESSLSCESSDTDPGSLKEGTGNGHNGMSRKRGSKRKNMLAEPPATPKCRKREVSASSCPSTRSRSRGSDLAVGGRTGSGVTSTRRQSSGRRRTCQEPMATRKGSCSACREALQSREAECNNTAEGSAGPGPGGFSPSEQQDNFDKPAAVVGEDEGTKAKYFYLVQRLSQREKGESSVAVRWLRECKDGLFRPDYKSTWKESADALVKVRTQWVAGKSRQPGGYKLLTLRKRILDTEIV